MNHCPYKIVCFSWAYSFHTLPNVWRCFNGLELFEVSTTTNQTQDGSWCRQSTWCIIRVHYGNPWTNQHRMDFQFSWRCSHQMFWNFRFGAVYSLAPVLFLAAYFNPKRMDIKTMESLFSTLRLWCVLGAQLNPRPVCFKCLNPIYISANLCSTPALPSFAIHGFPPHLAFLQPQELVLNPGHRHCRQPDPGRSTLQIQYIKWPAVVVGRFNTAFLWLCWFVPGPGAQF